jgi:hypothetical protein
MATGCQRRAHESELEGRPNVNIGKEWSEMDLFELGNMLTCGSSIEEIANFDHQFSDGRIRVTRWPREPAPGSRLLTTAAARSRSPPVDLATAVRLCTIMSDSAESSEQIDILVQGGEGGNVYMAPLLPSAELRQRSGPETSDAPDVAARRGWRAIPVV